MQPFACRDLTDVTGLGLDAASAAKTLGLAHWWLAADGTRVQCGGGWEMLLGTGDASPPSNIETLAGVVHPEDRARFRAALDAGRPATLTLRLAQGGAVDRVLCRMAPEPGGLTGLWVPLPETGAETIAGVVNADGEAAARRALAALPDGVSVYDPDDRLVLANSQMIELFGYESAQQIVGRRFEDLVRDVVGRHGVPEAVGREEEWLANMLAARADGVLDYEMELGDGRILRINDHLLPDGWRVGTRVDVTELRHRERAANDAMTKMREAIESLPDAVFLLDEEGRFLLANEQVKRIFPLMADTIVPGQKFENMLRIGLERGAYPEAVGNEEAWIAEAMAFWTRADTQVERTVRLANGRWVLAVDRRLPTGGWISLRIDVTEVKQNEARLTAILDGAGHGTWEWDIETQTYISNPLTDRTIDYWLDSIGYDRADIAGTPMDLFRSISHPDDIARLDAAHARHLAGEIDRIDVEIRQRHRDGSWLWGRMRGKISEHDPDGRPQRMAGVLVDITDLKRVQLDLERSARTKLEFLERVSHEIRTPLNGVLGAVSLLRAGGATPEQEELFEIAEESGEKLVAMIDRLVELTRLEDGRIQIEPAPLQIDELAEELRRVHMPAALARGISLDILTDAGAAEPRRADGVQLRRMLDRLIEYGIGRTALGGVEVRLRTISGDGMRVEVADTGPEISEADLARILEPLFHEDGNARDPDNGDGLGLWAVKRLAEVMGGTLGVSSELGGGLLVRLDLPFPIWTDEKV